MEYLSLNKYMKQNNVGYNIALQLINSGKLDYIKTRGGHYKILIDNNTTVPIEKYEKVVRENEKLKNIIANINKLSNI